MRFPKKGIPYLKKAADLGHAKAQYNLGICYAEGIGVPLSREDAIRYLELAVQQTQPEAARALEIVLMRS